MAPIINSKPAAADGADPSNPTYDRLFAACRRGASHDHHRLFADQEGFWRWCRSDQFIPTQALATKGAVVIDLCSDSEHSCFDNPEHPASPSIYQITPSPPPAANEDKEELVGEKKKLVPRFHGSLLKDANGVEQCFEEARAARWFQKRKLDDMNVPSADQEKLTEHPTAKRKAPQGFSANQEKLTEHPTAKPKAPQGFLGLIVPPAPKVALDSVNFNELHVRNVDQSDSMSSESSFDDEQFVANFIVHKRLQEMAVSEGRADANDSTVESLDDHKESSDNSFEQCMNLAKQNSLKDADDRKPTAKKRAQKMLAIPPPTDDPLLVEFRACNKRLLKASQDAGSDPDQEDECNLDDRDNDESCCCPEDGHPSDDNPSGCDSCAPSPANRVQLGAT
jgi:hypothetical protein